MMGIVYLIVSWILVAAAQPFRSILCSIATSIFGYALFWLFLSGIKKRKNRFLLSLFWAASIELVHNSWMIDTTFQGIYIVFVCLGMSVLLGMQFALFCLWIPDCKNAALRLQGGVVSGAVLKAALLAFFWVWAEWLRLFFLCGWTWNPIGIALTALPLSCFALQLWGMLGLSFWVFFTNALVYQVLFFRSFSKKSLFLISTCAVLPYLYGALFLALTTKSTKAASHRVVLLESHLLPCERQPLVHHEEKWVHPLEQWRSYLRQLKAARQGQVDLVLFPEGALFFPMNACVYSFDSAWKVLQELIGSEEASLRRSLPPWEAPYAEFSFEEKKCRVSNAFFAQTIANYLDTDVVIGLEAVERQGSAECFFQSAFFFSRQNASPAHPAHHEVYHKRKLLPLAEYLPFSFCKKWTELYGISDFYTPGSEAVRFQGKISMAPFICYEETFGDFVRSSLHNQVDLIVFLSNDGWYPNSNLALQHFWHGMLRSFELGIPIVRACNYGISGAIDPYGRFSFSAKKAGSKENISGKNISGKNVPDKNILVPKITSISLHTYRTPYRYWGDSGILLLSILISAPILFTEKARKRNNQPKVSVLLPPP